MSKSTKQPYPSPLTIDSPAEHTHTFILLHGRGSNAERFGHEHLRSANLPARLPTVRFVFPTARKTRATVFKKIRIHQWFDNYSLEDPGQKTDLQIDGLCETARFLRELIDHEARILGEEGYRRIILAGLSQGCAAGLFTLLGGGFGGDCCNEPLRAFVGMSGWLPFEAQLSEILRQQHILDSFSLEPYSKGESQDDTDSTSTSDGDEEDDIESGDDSDNDEEDDSSTATDNDDDPFATLSDNDDDSFDPFAQEEEDRSDNSIAKSNRRDDVSPTIQALNHIRDILDLLSLSLRNDEHNSEEWSPLPRPSTSTSTTNFSSYSYLRQTPVFLGHGSADPKVSVRLGERMASLLSDKLHMDVTWRAYAGFGHWYKDPDEIDDIVLFLRDKLGLPGE
ncbi:hypothetical protein VTN77DRAFT_5102 [Rasamsonia byssochlamydoides]|uniref:uncharacterized protein n=1 Tax=Rasamsonia byssochlamydoides TaxID=89139 RepID=UPI0037441865